ncbi:MAG: hypothetical protein OHK93_002961 [Ramalina farinacea]|uniref:Uncharacterized protein n=1 Tax=Ramalina farinacea TaxID=258253 RepID=A0AA43QSD6_9LECA|nr:hypothetical protein [Ramalina farinacea]
MLGPKILLLFTGAVSLTVAAPIEDAEKPLKLRERGEAKQEQLSKRVELYPAPDLGRIKVDDNLDKRVELYPAPDLGRIKVEDDLDKRTELYPAPDLGRIKVDDEVE